MPLTIGRSDRSKGERDRPADAEVFGKGIAWALKYDVDFVPADLKLLKTALNRFLGRVNALEAGKSPWFGRKGTWGLTSRFTAFARMS